MTQPDAVALAALNEARRAEAEQTRFYRALSADAELANDAETAERLNGLLADEQHHFSRITARLMELGEPIPDFVSQIQSPPVLANWKGEALERETAEIQRYRSLLAMELDARTRTLICEILDAEEAHVRALGGKWMRA
jgi:rubrerythrin